ncbi:MAG: hypothetical protein GX329_07025, partial [Tissierellia bacterium]|nr:hypothetical protein [Tissierellia bacterium]
DDGSIGSGAIMDVMNAAGEFLTAIFEKGKAQQIVINMNKQEVTIDSNSSQNEIIALAGAVFDVDASNGNYGVLFAPVSNFLGVGTEFTPTVKADFTMTVTNQDAIVFTLDGLTATFANVTQMD